MVQLLLLYITTLTMPVLIIFNMSVIFLLSETYLLSSQVTGLLAIGFDSLHCRFHWGHCFIYIQHWFAHWYTNIYFITWSRSSYGWALAIRCAVCLQCNKLKRRRVFVWINITLFSRKTSIIHVHKLGIFYPSDCITIHLIKGFVNFHNNL